MADFATYQDVEARWRPLASAEEQDRVTVLLGDASDMIRTRFPDIDDRLASGLARTETLVRIAAGMVKRALLIGEHEGVESSSDTAGPFVRTQSYANPSGNLYLSSDDIRTLGRSRRAFAVDLSGR